MEHHKKQSDVETNVEAEEGVCDTVEGRKMMARTSTILTGFSALAAGTECVLGLGVHWVRCAWHSDCIVSFG